MAGLTLPVGTEIGGYRLQGVLGQGASGTVYQAMDADGLVVAFKLLHPSVAADPAARQRLTREVELLQRVKAPCVARVLDAETQQAEAFVVTELVEGTSLESYIKDRGPLDLVELASLGNDLAAAIVTIHQAEVVHRDLKPSNVMKRYDGSVVLIDFGLAQEDAWSRLTGTGLVAGTPGFVAPELLRGADPGPGADRWAAAALLLSAATARPPFGGGSVQTVLAKVLEGQADTDGLEVNLAALFSQAIHPDPAQRLDMEPLVAALTALASGEEVLPSTKVATQLPDAGPRQVPKPAGPLWADQPTTEPPPRYPPSGQAAWPDTRTVRAFGLHWGQLDPNTKPTPILMTTLWLLLAALAMHWWPVGVVAVVLIWLARALWVGRQAQALRQQRRGPKPSDPARTAVGAPWYLLRALIGLTPSLATAVGSAIGAYWLIDQLTSWRSDLTDALLIGLVGFLLWWGPAGDANRQGGRLVVRALLPTNLGRAVLSLLAFGLAGGMIWLAW
ncbi:MAG: serine/threonine protein kinase [Micrococcales bacterium]|nr:serine/threonine protein kinase [Micrococcales bacterium]